MCVSLVIGPEERAVRFKDLPVWVQVLYYILLIPFMFSAFNYIHFEKFAYLIPTLVGAGAYVSLVGYMVLAPFVGSGRGK
jgi:hypothetical protein